MNQNNLFNYLRTGGSPQQVVMQMFNDSMGQNPMLKNLIQLAQQGNGQQIEQIARNMCASKGLDFDKEFNAFKQQLWR